MIRKLIRKMRGHGIRAEQAACMLRDHDIETAPAKREIKARRAALERLLDQLEKDKQVWQRP